jgi:hypothetical protein
MAINVSETYLMSLDQALRECAGAINLNGPASYMLAQELCSDVPVEDLTLRQVLEGLQRTRERYQEMCNRLETLGVR